MEQKKEHFPKNIHYVETGSHVLYVEALGDASHPACLCIPGAIQGTWGWSDFFCQRVVDSGFYVVRLDHRDTGRSTATPADKEYSLKDLALDAVAILDWLKIEKAHLAGHSMGGYICQQLALDSPERLLSICPIASGPLGATDATSQPLSATEQATLKKTWGLFLARKNTEKREASIQGFLAVYRHLNGTRPFDEELGRNYVTEMVEQSPKSYLQPGNPHEKLMERLFATLEERKGILQKIGVPTLIIHGDSDPLMLVRIARSMAEQIPGANYLEIPGMGHMFFNRELQETISDALIHHMLEASPQRDSPS